MVRVKSSAPQSKLNCERKKVSFLAVDESVFGRGPCKCRTLLLFLGTISMGLSCERELNSIAGKNSQVLAIPKYWSQRALQVRCFGAKVYVTVA